MRFIESLMSGGETVQLLTRQHWIVMLRTFVVGAVALTACAAAAVYGVRSTGDAGTVLAYVAVAGIAVVVALLVASVARWSKRNYVITTRRVMVVDGLLTKRVSDSNLDKVNDITLSQSILGRALGYGDLRIITGSEAGIDELPRIREPVRFQRVLLDNKEDFDALARIGDGAALDPSQIPQAIEELAALRERGLVTAEEFARKKADLLARM
jgi:uncharacterized membrane protein YdbT with pleckstrin-like domain